MIGLPRSTFYYRSTARHVELSDDKLAEMINAIQDEFPGYGYRRVTRELAARGAHINHKRAARIMRERALYAVTKRKFALKPKSGDEDGGVFPNLYLNVIPAIVENSATALSVAALGSRRAPVHWLRVRQAIRCKLWREFALKPNQHCNELRSSMDGGLQAFKALSGTIWIIMGKLVADLAEKLPVVSAGEPAQLL